MLDENNNSNLDPQEGRIIVSGGIDGSTNAPFLGSFSADANASVITPLTTLISSLLDLGLDKNTSLAKLNQTLDLNISDVTNYDPLKGAALNDENAGKVLIESARVANVFKQTEAFLEYKTAGNYESGSASVILSKQIADDLSGDSPKYLLDDPDLLNNTLTDLVTEQVDSLLINDEEKVSFLNIVKNTDALHKTLSTQEIDPGSLLSELTKQQFAIELDVISVYQDSSVVSMVALAATTTTESLMQRTEVFSNLNLFAPQADDFSYFFRSSNIPGTNHLIQEFASFDYDDDPVEIEIISGNVDTDGDGIYFLSISAGKLVVQDADEFSNLMSQQISVLLSLSDGRGKVSETKGKIFVDNELTFASEVSLDNGWANSPWLGAFFPTGSAWIYHSRLGWLYVYPDGAGGYWFWDAVYSNWWWSNQNIFPYFFLHSQSPKWNYFDLGQSIIRAYDFDSEEWLIRP
jgi:hypothetical protein